MTRRGHDAGLRLFAKETLEDVRARESGGAAVAQLMKQRREKMQPLAQAALSESTKEARTAAVDQLEMQGGAVALPVLRQVLYGDPSREVRRRAALALAWMGDAEVIDRFVVMVQGRSGNDEDAKTAVYALGVLGDVRGAEALLAAFVDGWKPGVIAESMRTLGLAILQPAVNLAEVRPEALERQALRGLFEKFPAEALARELLDRVEASRERPDFIERATVYLRLAAENKDAGKKVAARLTELPAVAGDKALSRLAKKVLG
jgi:hypothetical protein